jgi:hypothetical protein
MTPRPAVTAFAADAPKQNPEGLANQGNRTLSSVRFGTDMDMLVGGDDRHGSTSADVTLAGNKAPQ